MSHLFAPTLARPLFWMLVGLLAAVVAAPLHHGFAQTPGAASPAATPTASPPDAGLAESLRTVGKLDEAIGAYAAVIAEGSQAQRLSARLALAQVLLDVGRADAAVLQLDAYLMEAPAGQELSGAQLLMADALQNAGRYVEAVSLYDTYLRDPRTLAAYAQLGRAQALAWSVDPGAHAGGEAALESDIPPSARNEFILSMAQALEGTQPALARLWYERLRQESDLPSDDALATWRIAQIDGSTGPEALRDILGTYPESATAQALLDDMSAGEESAISPYVIGLVRYHAGQLREARSAFMTAMMQPGSHFDPAIAARASFYLGVLEERDGKLASAAQHYSRVAELDPGVELADDALWWRGRVLERQDRPAKAKAVYAQLIDEFGSSTFASEARFRLGLLEYDSGDFARAASSFEETARNSRGKDRARAQLWQGKALDAAGEDAQSVWDALAANSPTEYYGLRAAVLLGADTGTLRSADLDAADDTNWQAIEGWLAGLGAGDPLAAETALAGNRHWTVAQALLDLGMEHRAAAELEDVLQASLGDPNVLLVLAREFDEIGQAGLSSRAASRLLNQLPQSQLAGAPDDLWRIAYPAPFAEVLDQAADDSDVANLLLLSLVRQESFFDPLAGSSAGAIGLTQVVAPTGDEIAEDLGLDDFDVDDLHRPAVSLQFGAHYLRKQLDLLDDNVYYALAAYNGGPGNAARWASTADGDVDRFVAEIEFSQTEAYVQLVMENLARYRQLYQGYDTPVLPER